MLYRIATLGIIVMLVVTSGYASTGGLRTEEQVGDQIVAIDVEPGTAQVRQKKGTNDATAELKKQLCIYLEQLLAFKDESKFKYFGFGTRGPYNKWMTSVEALRDAQPTGAHPIPILLRAAPGDLLMLGMEYMRKGETNYTRQILPEMKGTIDYTTYLTEKKRKAAEKPVSRKVESRVARKYTIVKCDDISVKALTKLLSEYKPGEVGRLPMNVRKVYRILVPSGISPEDLKATMIQLVKDETLREPDIDEIAIFAYDRKEDVKSAYTLAQLEWCPNGNWGGMTPEIALSNDRSTYKFNIEIKGRVEDPSGQPTERELRIHDALEKELWADSSVPEEQVNKKVAAQLNITVEELKRVWLKVVVYKLK